MSVYVRVNCELNQFHAVSRTQQGRQREPRGCLNPVPYFPRILEALRVEWRNSTPRFASTPQRRNENINVNKYFMSSSGIELTTSRFYIHTLCPCASATTSRISLYIYK